MIFLILIYILIFILCFIGLLLCYDSFVLKKRQEYKTAKSLPSSKMYPIIGSIHDILSLNPEKAFTFLRNNALKYKESYSHYYLGYLVLDVIRAKDAEPVLNSSKHINKSMIYEFLHPFMGTGLLTSNGKKWFQRRKILTPAFHFNILQQFYKIFTNETELFIETLKKIADSPNGVVLQDLISRFTLNTICETAMGVKISSLDEPDDYRRTIYEIGEKLVYRLMRPWIHQHFAYKMTTHRVNFMKLVKKAHSFTRNVIKQRKESFRNGNITIDYNLEENIYETKKTRYAMLDTLLASESNGNIDEEGIGEEVDTFMFEGHDTTSSGLVFSLLLLAHHPEAQEKIFEEIMQEFEKNNGNDFTANQYANMRYFDCVLKECFRLYPPVAFIAREIDEELILNGRIFPAGSLFQFHIYDIHRDPEQFPDPEKFDPDRFLPENIAKRHLFSYIPFSAGPRNCIGQKFALLEIKTLLTKIILNFKILPITRREDIVFVADLVLRSLTPIKVKFNLRNKV